MCIECSSKWRCKFWEMYCISVSISCMCSVCVCVCVCAHMYVPVCLHVEARDHLLMSSLAPFPLNVWNRVSLWAWSSQLVRPSDQWAPEIPHLHPGSYRGMPPCQPFTWMLGFWAQVLLHGYSTLQPLNNLFCLHSVHLLSASISKGISTPLEDTEIKEEGQWWCLQPPRGGLGYSVGWPSGVLMFHPLQEVLRQEGMGNGVTGRMKGS